MSASVRSVVHCFFSPSSPGPELTRFGKTLETSESRSTGASTGRSGDDRSRLRWLDWAIATARYTASVVSRLDLRPLFSVAT